MKAIRLAVACLAALAAHSAQADISGRLFFTPDQRAMLDNARLHNIQQATEEQAALSGGVTFNGVVQRSDGHATLWVNNHALSGTDAASRFGTVKKDGTPMLKMPYPGQTVDLKVGQRLDPVTGKALEPYQGRPKTEAVKAPPTAEKREAPSQDKTAPTAKADTAAPAPDKE